MCGWMSECGLLVILTLSLCQAKSLGPHDYPFPTLLNPGSQSQVPGNAPDFSQTSSLTELEGSKGAGVGGYEPSGNDVILSEDSANSMENALLNYLYTKNMMRRLRQQIEANTLMQQRKRNNGNYWKMCAFNAVSCFG